MPEKFYRRVDGGITFVFKAEPGHPELLHIFARHRTEPDDAINTFFDENAQDE
jgi:hypothetical protein